MGADGFGALVLPFDTDSPEFARGVEVGRLWEQLRADPTSRVEQTIHATNAEMAMRVAEATGRPFGAEQHDDVWMTVRFGPADEGAPDAE